MPIKTPKQTTLKAETLQLPVHGYGYISYLLVHSRIPLAMKLLILNFQRSDESV